MNIFMDEKWSFQNGTLVNIETQTRPYFEYFWEYEPAPKRIL